MIQRIITSFCIIAFLHSSLSAQIIYSHPMHGSEYNSPQTNIVFRSKHGFQRSSIDKNHIELAGKEQQYDFSLIFSDNDRVLIVEPHQSFAFNDEVSVTVSGARNILGEQLEEMQLKFQVSKSNPTKPQFLFEKLEKETFLTAKSDRATLSFYHVLKDSAASTDPIFFRNNSPLYTINRYTSIVENNGDIVYAVHQSGKGANFQLQPSGYLSFYAVPTNTHKVVDSNYVEIDSKGAGNGYTADMHEFIHKSDGHYIILIYDQQTVDMSAIYPGGNPNADVVGCIIQELDENDNVIFQWRTWDHFSILDCIDCDFTQSAFEYCHINSIDIDNDGDYIISSRLFDEVTKFSRTTGNLIWRLGGLNNEFTFTNDTIGFSHQHDARRIGNGNITLYDNGNLHNVLVSRGIEYQLDTTTMSATLVWSFIHPDSVYGKAMGSMQRLPNGNSLIGWGWVNQGVPAFTEVDVNGNIVYEAMLDSLGMTYRARRYAWYPDSTFTTNIEENIEDQLTVYPNPSSDFVYISSVTAIDKIELLNMNGQLLRTSINPSEKYFDVSSIPKGIYLLRIHLSGNVIRYVKVLVN